MIQRHRRLCGSGEQGRDNNPQRHWRWRQRWQQRWQCAQRDLALCRVFQLTIAQHPAVFREVIDPLIATPQNHDPCAATAVCLHWPCACHCCLFNSASNQLTPTMILTFEFVSVLICEERCEGTRLSIYTAPCVGMMRVLRSHTHNNHITLSLAPGSERRGRGRRHRYKSLVVGLGLLNCSRIVYKYPQDALFSRPHTTRLVHVSPQLPSKLLGSSVSAG